MYPWVQMFSFNPLSTVTNKLSEVNKGASYSKVQGLPWQLLYSSLWHLTGRWREYERRISFPYLLWEFLRDLEWKGKELGSPTGILYGQSCSLLTQSKAVAPGNLQSPRWDTMPFSSLKDPRELNRDGLKKAGKGNKVKISDEAEDPSLSLASLKLLTSSVALHKTLLLCAPVSSSIK